MLPQFMQDLSTDIYLSSNFVVLDFEATNLDKGSPYNEENELLLACWYYKGQRKHCWGDELNQAELVSDIEQADFVVAHNAKFELGWLRRCGIELGSILTYCTMLGEYVRCGNLKKLSQLSLGIMAPQYGYPGKEPYVNIMNKLGVCMSAMPRSLVLSRCRYDVEVTRGIFLKQRKILKRTGKLPTQFTRCILSPVLADIESNGLNVDKEKVRAEYITVSQQLSQAESELLAVSPETNFNSPKQVAELVYDVLGFKEPTKKGKPIRTPAGGRKADTTTLSKLKAGNKKQKKFLDAYLKYSSLSAKISKTLRHLNSCADNDDILYANFNQTNTATHRLSSTGKTYGVQFQNFPREYKPLFTARNEGWLVSEIDGSQLEFRVAAFVGQDEQAITDIRNKEDVHRFTASVINDVTEDEVTKDQRTAAKAHTFKPLYGGQSGTPAEVRYYGWFRLKYPGIANKQLMWLDEAVMCKSVRTCTGLQYYFPNAYVTRGGYVNQTTNIYNYSIQGLATAEIIPVAMVYMWYGMRDLQSFIVNTVHDSVISEVHPDEVETLRQIGEDAFTTKVYIYLYKVYGIKFNVPLGTGFTASTHWAWDKYAKDHKAEELTTQVEPPEVFD